MLSSAPISESPPSHNAAAHALPPVIEGTRQRHITSVQASAVVAYEPSTTRISLSSPPISESPPSHNAAHALPSVIEAIRQAHITSAQANAVVAALFAGVQGQLISSIPSDQTTPLSKALNFFSYGGLVLSVGASLSAMSLIDSLGHIPEQYWRLGPKGQQVAELQANHSDFELLECHGGSSSMKKTYTHCQISLIFGAYSLLLQIALLAWVKLGSDVVFAFTVVCLFWVCLLYPGEIIFAFFQGIVRGYRRS